MTAEKQPNMFMVLGVHGCPVDFVGMEGSDERDNPYIFHSFDEALKVAKWYQKDMDCPTTIVMLSVLAEHITPESLNSPILDYVPQRIMRIENADQLGEELKICQKQNERIAPLVEGWGKVMKTLSELGWLIDKAKEDQTVGGKKL